MRWFQKHQTAAKRFEPPPERAEDVFQIATCADLLGLQPSLVTRRDWLPSLDVSIPSVSAGQIKAPEFCFNDCPEKAWSTSFYKIDDGFSYEIKDAVVHRNLGVITCGRYVVLETLRVSRGGLPPDFPEMRWIDDKTVYLPSAPHERHVGFALHALRGCDDDLAYVHWLTSTLPVVGEHLIHGLAEGATILLPANVVAFQKQMLNLLPPLTNALFAEETGRFRCDRLVFVPKLFAPDAAPHPRGLEMIRKLLADHEISRQRERKIYLRRKSLGAQEMANEEEACQALRRADFEIHDLDADDVIDRMRRAASAHTIAAHHRDGLVDMIFAPPWVRVIEFHRDTNVDWSMRRLSAIVPASYGCLIGRRKPKRMLQSKKDAERNPWLLSISELKKLLS